MIFYEIKIVHLAKHFLTWATKFSIICVDSSRDSVIVDSKGQVISEWNIVEAYSRQESIAQFEIPYVRIRVWAKSHLRAEALNEIWWQLEQSMSMLIQEISFQHSSRNNNNNTDDFF